MVKNQFFIYKMSNSPAFIQPLPIHKEYGVIHISGIEVLNLQIGSSDKKYRITIRYNGIVRDISYGDKNYQQFEDRTPLGIYTENNHYDDVRRKAYLARSSRITNSYGDFTVNDPFSPNRYSIITLW